MVRAVGGVMSLASFVQGEWPSAHAYFAWLAPHDEKSVVSWLCHSKTLFCKLPPGHKKTADAVFFGAGGGSWTHTLSNMPLKHARLPFRHARLTIFKVTLLLYSIIKRLSSENPIYFHKIAICFFFLFGYPNIFFISSGKSTCKETCLWVKGWTKDICLQTSAVCEIRGDGCP